MPLSEEEERILKALEEGLSEDTRLVNKFKGSKTHVRLALGGAVLCLVGLGFSFIFSPLLGLVFFGGMLFCAQYCVSAALQGGDKIAGKMGKKTAVWRKQWIRWNQWLDKGYRGTDGDDHP